MNKQSGFTLIELIMVIVILGILAATAIPRYVNLQTQAQDAALDGVLGAAQATVAIRYAAAQAGVGSVIANCSDVPTHMDGSFANYAFSGAGSTCTITASGTAGSGTRTFNLIQ